MDLSVYFYFSWSIRAPWSISWRNGLSSFALVERITTRRIGQGRLFQRGFEEFRAEVKPDRPCDCGDGSYPFDEVIPERSGFIVVGTSFGLVLGVLGRCILVPAAKTSCHYSALGLRRTCLRKGQSDRIKYCRAESVGKVVFTPNHALALDIFTWNGPL